MKTEEGRMGRISIGLTSKISKKGGGMDGILMRITRKGTSSHVQQNWIFPSLMGTIQPGGFTRQSNFLTIISLQRDINLKRLPFIWRETH
jgi:hypothetical protein